MATVALNALLLSFEIGCRPRHGGLPGTAVAYSSQVTSHAAGGGKELLLSN